MTGAFPPVPLRPRSAGGVCPPASPAFSCCPVHLQVSPAGRGISLPVRMAYGQGNTGLRRLSFPKARARSAGRSGVYETRPAVRPARR
jgi:hypothetical protein